MANTRIIRHGSKFYVEVLNNLPEQSLVAGDVFGPFNNVEEATQHVKDTQAGPARFGEVLSPIADT